MTFLPLLSTITFLPLLGALIVFLFVGGGPKGAARARTAALVVSLATLGLCGAILARFDSSQTGFQMMERFVWIPSYAIAYVKGVDGISVWFVAMAAFLTPLAIMAAWRVETRAKEFMIALLVLETMMIGTFTSLDFVLFYVFFEGVLLPMYLIIGVWGGEKRVYAAYKFFLYTLAGSVLMLIAVVAMALHFGTTDMTAMMGGKFSKEAALWLWLAFFASFAVKTPMVPLHTWLPFAHVEAPTAGSVILAGVLLKMGGYGFLRVSIQMLPEASAYFAPYVIALSLVAVVYASFVAWAQTDMKKLIAYSSVAHMGYVTLGLFCFNMQGFDGAMMTMLSHAFVAGGLFLCAGAAHDRLGTHEIARFGGVAAVMPRYAAFFMIFALAAIGLPGLSGFVGEFLSLQGAYLKNPWMAGVASLGVVLSAIYMLGLYRRIFFGPIVKKDVRAMKDLSGREVAMLAPLVVLILWIGLYPSTFRNVYAPTLERTLTLVQAQIDDVPDEEEALHD